LLLGGVLVLGRRLTVHGVLIATAVTAAVLTVVNVLRLLVILVATHWWGLAGGYRWSHEVYGSLITVAGVCGGVALFLKLVVRYSHPRPLPSGAP
jgi:exosortase/archaeosortase family protein